MIISAVFSLVVALAAFAAMNAGPAAAEAHRPWCVDYPTNGVSCAFSSYEQCMLTARGAGGNCIQNPWSLQYGGQKYGTQGGAGGPQSGRR
ncbi:MAG TPA: DUF3551 domain-containing protein [Xanthobacteraceae bacterium]|jgi:hypothetical protein